MRALEDIMIHMEDIMIHIGDILGTGSCSAHWELIDKTHLFYMIAPLLNCGILPDKS